MAVNDRADWTSARRENESAAYPKPPREINRITDTYLAGINLIGPNLEVREVCLPVDRSKGTVYSVVTRADANATDPWLVKSSVKDLPSAAEIDFAVSVKILRGARVLIPDIWHVAADIAGRQIEGSTEGYGGMSKVAADAIATLDDVIGRKIWAARKLWRQTRRFVWCFPAKRPTFALRW